MADTIHLDREYTTNGTRIPAGQVSTDDLRNLIRSEKGTPITEEEAKAVKDDLLRRQARYAEYSKGITERHENVKDAGSMSVGGSD